MTSTNIPLYMKAIVLTEDGGKPEIREIPTPQPGPGEVLVKMVASPINPSDLAFLAGGYGIQRAYPTVPGLEGSGTVVKAGKGILPKLWMGKKVACAATPVYNGCWAEYLVTKAGMCVPISKNISLEQASMMFVNPMTALAFFDVYNHLPNPSKKKRGIINTAAASSLGKMIIKLGKRNNIPVISVVRRNEQVNLLKSEGAEYIVNSSAADFNSKLKELAHNLNASVLFDAIGGKMPQTLLDAAPKGSKLFIYGRLSNDICEIYPGPLIFSGNQINGFWLSGWLKNKSFWQSVKNTRKIQSLLKNELSSVVQEKYVPEQILEALDTYKNNMSKGKVLIKF